MSIQQKIRDANQEALSRLISAQPVAVDVCQAKEVIPLLAKSSTTFLHAGPPVAWEDMCRPMQGAMVGAAIFEGLAETPEEARKLHESGKINYSPCHDNDAVGSMSGVITPSMGIWVVENKDRGNKSFSCLVEGRGHVLRFGANDQGVIDRLKWMRSVLTPALSKCLKELGGIDTRALIAQAIQMGDEVHNRTFASTNLLLRALAPTLVKVETRENAVDILQFISDNDHFFNSLGMASCKAIMDSAKNIAYSSLVMCFARNGVEHGIKISGLGETWFTAPSPYVKGLYFPGYSEADACPDLGDSAITETAGIGAYVMAAAPAITQFVGGSTDEAIQYTIEMREITIGTNPNYTIPGLDFAPAPIGTDMLKVMEKSITPIINTGIAHKDEGVGQIGAGLVRAPFECYEKAFNAFAEKYLGD